MKGYLQYILRPLTLKGAQEELARYCLQMAEGETKYLKLMSLGAKGLLLFQTWELPATPEREAKA